MPVKRTGVLGGVTAALFVLVLVAVCSGPAEAWPTPPSPSSRDIGTIYNPVQQLGYICPREGPQAQTIESIIGKLAAIKAQKAELDRAEKETIALLKGKLKEQKERLKKLGVNVEEGETPPMTSPSLPPISAATVPGP